MALHFYIVDVFAEKKYAGNQLGVFRNAAGLSDTMMQRLAKEVNYSETTFILSDEDREGGFDVRIFTPQEEIPFAGHPTLGTAFVIREEVMRRPAETVVLNLKAGRIPVRFEDSPGEGSMAWMRQNPPVMGGIVERKIAARALGLGEAALDARFPVQEVSTGLPFLIVPLNTMDDLRQARVSVPDFALLADRMEAKSVLLFCPQTREEANHLSVRVFAPAYGVPEDPATGSANGCLAAYLVSHRYFGQAEVNVRVEQGHEVGRPSLLFLRAGECGEGIEVFVGGRSFLVARGEFL